MSVVHIESQIQTLEAIEEMIPAEIEGLLRNISDDAPTGEDIEEPESQKAFKLYSQLSAEVDKFDKNDFEKINKWAKEILVTYSKHLKIALWLLQSWLMLEGVVGLKKGFYLLIGLYTRFGDRLHPAKPEWQENTLSWLNDPVITVPLTLMVVEERFIPEWILVRKLFKKFEEECGDRLQKISPNLDAFHTALDDKIKQADVLLEAKEKERREQIAHEEEVNRQRNAASAAAESIRENQPQELRPEIAPLADGLVVTAAEIRLEDSPQQQYVDMAHRAEFVSPPPQPFDFDEYLKAESIETVMTRLLLYQINSAGPASSYDALTGLGPRFFGWSRTFKWAELVLPASVENVTTIPAPSSDWQNRIRVRGKSVDDEPFFLQFERSFFEEECFTYWFDAHRCQIEVLEKISPRAEAIIDMLKLHLARLLQRLPDLPELLFADARTRFADQDTIAWIDKDIGPMLSPKTEIVNIGLPIPWEDYEPINDFYQQAVQSLPAYFEENVKEMQQRIESELGKKGRFLWTLRLADYCFSAGKYPVAKVLLNDLLKRIDDFHLLEWENALCLSVWQSLFRTNAEIMTQVISPDQIETLKNEQKDLYERIALYSPLAAIHLEERKRKEGKHAT